MATSVVTVAGRAWGLAATAPATRCIVKPREYGVWRAAHEAAPPAASSDVGLRYGNDPSVRLEAHAVGAVAVNVYIFNGEEFPRSFDVIAE